MPSLQPRVADLSATFCQTHPPEKLPAIAGLAELFGRMAAFCQQHYLYITFSKKDVEYWRFIRHLPVFGHDASGSTENLACKVTPFGTSPVPVRYVMIVCVQNV